MIWSGSEVKMGAMVTMVAVTWKTERGMDAPIRNQVQGPEVGEMKELLTECGCHSFGSQVLSRWGEEVACKQSQRVTNPSL